MKKLSTFKIQVCRGVWENGTVIINAASIEDAISEAEELALAGSHKIVWEDYSDDMEDSPVAAYAV